MSEAPTTEPIADPQEASASEQSSQWTPPASQEELDRIIEDRLARERRKFADYSDLKAKAAGMDKALADAKSAGEKSAAQRFTKRLIDAEVKAGAKGLRFHDPADAIQQLGDMTSAVKDDGEVDADAISAALTDLANKKPYLVAQEEPLRPRSRPRARQSQQPESTPDQGNKTRAAEALRRFAAGR